MLLKNHVLYTAASHGLPYDVNHSTKSEVVMMLLKYQAPPLSTLNFLNQCETLARFWEALPQETRETISNKPAPQLPTDVYDAPEAIQHADVLHG